MGLLNKLNKRGEPSAHHAVVVWKQEDGDDGGDPRGSVFVEYYANAATRSESVKWKQPASRAEAQSFASKHDYEFQSDD